jgi:TonB family protein
VQGSVVYEVVVNKQGKPSDITVMTPLGYGLDEAGRAAIEKWEFAPGTMQGSPVSALITVELKFGFRGTWFDEEEERRRTSFNSAVMALQFPDSAKNKVALDTIAGLSKKNYAAALYVTGLWKINGEYMAKDPVEGLKLVQRAADKNYAPAIYELARRRIRGMDMPQNVEQGLKEMHDASILGSAQAQYFLGHRCETGIGRPAELDSARRYFRLCATQGFPACQYRLGLLLFKGKDRPERDYLQAVALFQLAGEQGHAEAKRLASSEAPKLTAEQSAWVSTLKRQIVRK